jgi:hypothetical protein
MAFDLRIYPPRFAEDRIERREPRERSTSRHCEQCEHHERRERDPIERLPGQMANIAGATILGGMTLGFLGAFNK